MADKRTSEMVQRRAAYVPEGLRPDGFLEKLGWYSGNIPQDFSGAGTGPWSIAEREYDTKPFGADIGVDPMMELILRGLLMGGSQKAPPEKQKKTKKPAENNYNVNEQSNRYATMGDLENNY